MKRIIAILLMLVMLLPLCLPAEADQVAIKPFYGGTWTSVNRKLFPNLGQMPAVYIYPQNGINPYFYYGGVDTVNYNMAKLALEVRNDLRKLPEGLRYMQFMHPVRIFSGYAESAIYLDKGVEVLKGMVTDFLKEYKNRGGLLDGIIMDLEYQNIQSWWIFQRFYQQGQTTIYKDIVNHPLYATKIRPMLEERGFKFWPNPSGNKSEIWSIYPYSGAEYNDSRTIWDNVMRTCLVEYLNEAIWEPLQEYYPDAHMSDYQNADTYGWQKKLNREGGTFYLGGNVARAGDTSNLNTYLVQPSAGFFYTAGAQRYTKIPSYNKAVYDNDSYNMLLWDVNRFKNMYEATDTGRVNMWICEYDTIMDSYYNNRESSLRNNAYYTEMLLHAGMLNPDLFLLFIPWETRPDLTTDEERNLRYEAISDCLNELTDKVGAADRKPILVPANWNDGYILSGMYAGGRNVWRITPDTTNGTTLESFKVKDKTPTFQINGKTIIFPKGTILETGDVAAVGSCGYWIETPVDVTPVVVSDEDRFENNPSYIENFERYTAGTAFNADNVKEKDAWEFSGTTAKVTADGDNKVLTVSGNSTISNVKLPQNITAGDSYAKQQAWEVSFTLPANLSGGTVKMLTCGTDGGFTISGNGLYYDKNGTATQFAGLTLSAGTKYTVRREMNFNNNTCTYLVFANGRQVAKAENIKNKSVTLPVEKIGFATSGLGSQTVLLDDYKLYPMGFVTDFEVYNANTGIKLTDMTQAASTNVAYRLSWLNATDSAKKATVKAQYYKNGTLQSTVTVGEITMAPGNDGVSTAIVENKAGMTVKLVMETSNTTLAPLPDYDSMYAPEETPDETPDATTDGTTDSTTDATTDGTTDSTTDGATDATTDGTTDSTTDVTTDSTTDATTDGTADSTTNGDQDDETLSTTAPDGVNSEKGSGGLWIVIALIGIVLVGGAVTAGWFLLEKKQSAAETDETVTDEAEAEATETDETAE